MADSNNEFAEQLEALQEAFAAQLGARLEALDAAYAVFARDGAPPEESRHALEDLCAHAHKLTGSAGTFGFAAVSDAAGRLEFACVSLLEAGDDAKPGHDREEIAGLISAVRVAAGQDAPEPMTKRR